MPKETPTGAQQRTAQGVPDRNRGSPTGPTPGVGCPQLQRGPTGGAAPKKTTPGSASLQMFICLSELWIPGGWDLSISCLCSILRFREPIGVVPAGTICPGGAQGSLLSR